MRPFPVSAGLCALAVLLAADTAGQAAWNNVFQVSCFRSRRTEARYQASCCPAPAPVVAYAAPVCAPPPPVCTTQYVQRSYYQPVTSYQQKSYYEPVTSYQTSYYYEPVTSYRYSCRYDPCTCSYQQVATPTTCYQLRSKCNPVTSYLQRTQLVPVTSYQVAHYYEPVTSCCNTSVGAPVAAPPLAAPPAAAPPGVGEQQYPGVRPGVGEQQYPGARPGVGENPNTGSSDSFFRKNTIETNPPPMNGAEGSSLRQPRQPEAPPRVKLERIAYLSSPAVDGQVVQSDGQSPRGGARLLFVSAERESQKSVTADEQGRFRTDLDKGSWLVYVRNHEGTPVFQKRIDVNGSDSSPLQLTSR